LGKRSDEGYYDEGRQYQCPHHVLVLHSLHVKLTPDYVLDTFLFILDSKYVIFVDQDSELYSRTGLTKVLLNLNC
jgi:hypothetical protein